MQHISTQVETWKPVVGYEGFYEVSDSGSVRSVDRITPHGHKRQSQQISLATLRSGYVQANVWRDNKLKTLLVHRGVAEAFIGPIPEGMVVCHNDGDPSNNRVENLRIDTQSENILDTVRHGTNPQSNKTHCPRNHPLEGENLRPNKGPNRECLSCRRAGNYLGHHKPFTEADLKAWADRYYAAIIGGYGSPHKWV